MKKTSSWYVILSGFMVLCIILAGCAKSADPTVGQGASTSGPAAEKNEPTKLVVASFYPVDQVSGWEGLVSKFKEKHPNVTIEVQVTPSEQYLAKLLSQIAGGDAPDIVGIENSPFPQFVSKEMLMDLTPYLEKTEGFSTQEFFPHLLDRYTYDSKVFGIPYDAQPLGLLFYNPALFDEAGVAYPTADWTWNDLLSAGTRLTKADTSGTTTQWGVVGLENRMFLYAFGGGYVDDLRNPTRSILNEQKSIDGVQFYVDLMHQHKITPSPATLESLGGSSVVDLFVSGKAAMLAGGFWNAVENPEGFKNINARLVMAPTGPDGYRLYATGGTAYSILKSSKNADLAWEFIQSFLGQVGYEEAYKSAAMGAIYPPAHIPSFDWYMEQKLEFVDTIQPNKDALDHIRFAPYPLIWSEIESKCIIPDMDLIERNQKPVAETMNAMAACVNDALKK